MALTKIRAVGSRAFSAAGRMRVWLRWVMKRVAVAAGALFVLWLLTQNTRFDETSAGNLLDSLTLMTILATCVYFGTKALIWLKRKLLWRVRRRLVVTYVFIGVTPIVLLLLLMGVAGFIVAGQAMSRIITSQVVATERQTMAAARDLADDFAALPAGASEPTVQRWLDERVAALQASLPGARAALWRAGASRAGVGLPVEYEEPGMVGQTRPAEVLSAPVESEETRGVGDDASPFGAPLPAWIANHAEWGGFSFMPPRTPDETFGTPSTRALVRRTAQERGYTVLLVVPVSRALVKQYRETTGIHVRPYFLGSDDLTVEANDEEGLQIRARRGTGAQLGTEKELERRVEGQTSRPDQFGEQVNPSSAYIVVLPATNWESGKTDTRLSFAFNFSPAEARQQLLGGSAVGEWLQNILVTIAVAFLVLELVALLAAAWMTHAVTGLVHKLHVATEFVRRGDFSHRIKTSSRDQLGELALAFNEMSSNIETLLTQRVEHERLERELEIAAEVQAQLFPRGVPQLRTVEVAGECRAARGVAGDYYDYIEAVPGLVAFALGDVSGKGVSASLVMSNLQATLRAQVTIIGERLRLTGQTVGQTVAVAGISKGGEVELAVETAPCGVTGIDTNCAVENMVAGINGQLTRSTDANRFATLFLALYDDRERTLRYTNAGHNAGILVRADGIVERLSTGGTLVGAFDWAQYEEAEVMLEAGDLLVIFSDGISEAQNAVGEEYGEERLVQLAATSRDKSADELRQAIFEEVDNWSGAQERGDDQTLVILKAVTGDR